MTYRTDNKIRRYVKGYGFMSFAKNLGNKYGKKIMSATSKLNQSKYGNMLKKHGNGLGKIVGKKILTKSAEATGSNQLIEDAQDLDIVMPMFNLLYFPKIFRKTARSFWNYYPHKPNSNYVYPVGITAARRERAKIFQSIYNSESFNYKTKFINVLDGINDNANNDVNTESEEIKIIVPLKNLSNFIFSLDFLMINTEIELILKWSQNCALTPKST